MFKGGTAGWRMGDAFDKFCESWKTDTKRHRWPAYATGRPVEQFFMEDKMPMPNGVGDTGLVRNSEVVIKLS